LQKKKSFFSTKPGGGGERDVLQRESGGVVIDCSVGLDIDHRQTYLRRLTTKMQV